jgi:probable rRNA maturation factor
MAAAVTPPELDLAFSLEAEVDSDGAAPPGGLLDPQRAEGHWSAHLGAWLAQLQPELPAGLRAAAYSLGLALCDDEAMAELNRTWRQQSGPTDVLAFAAQEDAPPAPAAGSGAGEGEPGACLELGDIVISLDTARRQAIAAGHDLEEELLFLASHGLLHLLGWDHPDEDSLAAMLARQRVLLAATPC